MFPNYEFKAEGKEAKGNKQTKLFNIESVPDRHWSLWQLNGSFELVQTLMEDSLIGGISKKLEIEIKMGIESEGWNWKFV